MFGKKLILLVILAIALFSAFSVNTLGADKTVTANGNAQIDTAQSKFGGASVLFDGTGDYLSTADSDDWNFGTGDFTIDFWVRFNVLPATGSIAEFYSQCDGTKSNTFRLYNAPGAGYSWELTAWNGASFDIYISKPTTVSTGTWYHVACVRNGNNLLIFQGGTQVGTTGTSASAFPDLAASVYIGSYDSTQLFLNGWLDEYRVSKGVARWTSSFAVPSASHSADTSTKLLLHCDGPDSSTTIVDTSTPSAPSNPDFTISFSKNAMSMNVGGSDTSTITVTSIAGFSETVMLASSWTGTAPTGATVAFSQNSVTLPRDGSATSTLSISADMFSSTGTHTLTVTGTAGGTTHTVTILVTITAQSGTYNFRVRAGTTKITVTCTWSTAGSVTMKLVNPSTTYNEPDMTIYEKTTIYAGGTTSYTYLKRAQLTIQAPATDQTWVLQLTTTVTTYTVSIEVT